MKENKREVEPRIIIDERVRFGKPVIAGTRVSVELILGKLAGGMTYEEIMAEYGVSREDILAVLDYAERAVSGEEVKVIG